MKLDTIVQFVVVAAIASTAGAQSLLRSVSGPAASAQYGKACIVVPDQNSDGVKDVLVGAPGFNNGYGAIFCLSGAFLATGTGTQTLWSTAPANPPYDREFGSAIVDVGDISGDGVRDFLVGEPGYQDGTSNVGAVRLVSGSSHAVLSTIRGDAPNRRLGSAIAAAGDVNGDGKTEVLIGAPGGNRVYSVMGSSLLGNTTITTVAADSLLSPTNDALGTSVASGFTNSSGSPLFVVGAPALDDAGGTDVGRIYLGKVDPHGILLLLNSYGFGTAFPGERLGSSVDAAHDYDGDGVTDIVVGAPNYALSDGTEVGRVVVLSGAKLAAQTPPYEIHNLIGIPGSLSLVLFDSHSGTTVRACGDLNGDGVGDILVGAPDYVTALGSGTRGYVAIYSGATGAQLGNFIFGGTHDHFGDAITNVVGDLDGDGFREFVFGGALSNAGGTDSGVIKCYRLFPITPTTYCTGKINSLGCTPAMSFTGSPSASSGSPFLVKASNEINQKTGLLFYAHQPVSVFFQGGTKCAGSPTLRTAVQSSGGSSSGNDCTGVYSFDFNALVASGVDASLVAGSEVYAQYWSRDPASPSTTSLSNALRFVINP